jgi:hypothetical protein
MGTINLCPICRSMCDIQGSRHEMYYHIHCNTCGEYQMTSDLIDDLPTEKKIQTHLVKVSAFTLFRYINGLPKLTICYERAPQQTGYISIFEIIHQFPPKVSERVDRVLMNLSARSRYTGDKFRIEPEQYPLFFPDSKDPDASHFLLRQLIHEGYIEAERNEFPTTVMVSAEGWNRIGQIERGLNVGSNQGFIAMWFDESMNGAAEEGFKRAIQDAGYTPLKINDKEHVGKIDDEIIAEIRRSRFVVCDFTGHRGGVYFEAGFAMGLGLPVIWTCRTDDIDQLHFDTRQYNHIVWENESDLYIKLYNRIRAVIV